MWTAIRRWRCGTKHLWLIHTLDTLRSLSAETPARWIRLRCGVLTVYSPCYDDQLGAHVIHAESLAPKQNFLRYNKGTMAGSITKGNRSAVEFARVCVCQHTPEIVETRTALETILANRDPNFQSLRQRHRLRYERTKYRTASLRNKAGVLITYKPPSPGPPP